SGQCLVVLAHLDLCQREAVEGHRKVTIHLHRVEERMTRLVESACELLRNAEGKKNHRVFPKASSRSEGIASSLKIVTVSCRLPASVPYAPTAWCWKGRLPCGLVGLVAVTSVGLRFRAALH